MGNGLGLLQLRHPRFGGAAPFVVLTHNADSDEELATIALGRWAPLLQRSEDVFLSLGLHNTGSSTFDDLTSECMFAYGCIKGSM